MKNFQRIIIILIFLAIVAVTYAVELRGKYVVPIVTYHSIATSEREGDGNSVSASNFEYQMAFLKKYKYNVISLDELVSAIRGRKELPHNSVVLTFDDGYVDNYENAFPILKRYKFPATFFIVPRLVGKKGYLTWEQAKEMDTGTINFGSHTYSHCYLPEFSEKEQKWEISASKKMIERRLGHPIHNFCYRTGGFTDFTKSQVQKAGYLSACTTNRGYDRFNHDVYELKRVRFGNNDKTFFVLWGKLLGYYNFFRKPVRPY